MDNISLIERRAQLAELLTEAAQAHDKYEQSALGGQYDSEWPRWYADYLVEHGLPDLLGRGDLSNEQLVEMLTKADANHRTRASEERWPDYYAGYLLENLPGE